MTKNYIEFRVYLKDGIELNDALLASGEYLKDTLCDETAEQSEIFDEDVTYTFHIGGADVHVVGE